MSDAVLYKERRTRLLYHQLEKLDIDIPTPTPIIIGTVHEQVWFCSSYINYEASGSVLINPSLMPTLLTPNDRKVTGDA